MVSSRKTLNFYPMELRGIGGKTCFFVLLSAAVLFLSSCAEVAKDMGFDQPSDIEQRTGPAGTENNPVVLDPFRKYNFVMAANECRFFMIKVPEKWYWKAFLTAVSPESSRRGKLSAEIVPTDPPWTSLADCVMGKNFQLDREGVQAVLGVFNRYPKRPAVLRLCQEGAPVHVTINSQVSIVTETLKPNQRSNSNKTE